MTVTVNTVNNVNAEATSTPARLLATLRAATERADLSYAAPPVTLSGGYYAEMLRIRLADPPPALGGDLVARIVPDPAAGAWEATVQDAVAAAGFSTPAVRMTCDASGPLGRYLIVMDAVDGAPPIDGLGPGAIVRRLPDLVRRLPTRLARIAADLHALDSAPLAGRLEALASDLPTTISGVVERQAAHALAIGRPDLARAAEDLVATEPRSTARSITHADLHPFNLLVSPEGEVVVDWTGARVAHPAFTIAFTHLVLGNPPILLPRWGTAALRPVGRRIARRFLDSYRVLTDGTPAAVDDEHLAWHQRVHALRILLDLGTWDAVGDRPAGHPWLVLEPVARDLLSLRGGPVAAASR